VVERADRPPVSTFYVPGAWSSTVELDEVAAHHANVKRLRVGDMVRLSNGDGRRAAGAIEALAKHRTSIHLDAGSIVDEAPLPVVELWAPVGDRERMLWLAEKAVELGASAWRPVVFRRSRSVTPRGEGEAFNEKVRLRMVNALEQSGSAWLPTRYAETGLAAALAGAAGVDGIVLDVAGAPILSLSGTMRAPIGIALGPEGGLEPDERQAFAAAGWRAGSLGPNVLRFETAGIAALAIVRSFSS
jgi:16S rRNA (uracil1498-N3)-methyltransferase